jgi:hypothetical protein
MVVLNFAIVFALFVGVAVSGISTSHVLRLRGGLVPQADDAAGYYEQFHLDYGTDDTERIAGALRGFIRNGALSSLPQKDSFLRWLNLYLETGPEPLKGRVKPYHVADFGKKSDLKWNEHPKIMIVNHKLACDDNGILKEAPDEVDLEVRTIWQPWLRARCNFAVRYVVPNRSNIIKIMQKKGKFNAKVFMKSKEDGQKKVWSKMTFKRDPLRKTVILSELDTSILKGGS